MFVCSYVYIWYVCIHRRLGDRVCVCDGVCSCVCVFSLFNGRMPLSFYAYAVDHEELLHIIYTVMFYFYKIYLYVTFHGINGFNKVPMRNLKTLTD